MIIRVGMVVKHSFSGSHYTIKSISPECKCDGDAPHFHLRVTYGNNDGWLNRYLINGKHIYFPEWFLVEVNQGKGIHQDLFEEVAA